MLFGIIWTRQNRFEIYLIVQYLLINKICLEFGIYKKCFEDTEVVIRRHKSKDKTMQWPKGQTMIYKALHRKLKIEQHKPHLKQLT
jgi:hypothetical protein